MSTAQECVNAPFGLSKKDGKPLNAGNWQWKLEFSLKFLPEHKREAIRRRKHTELRNKIGPELYNKSFTKDNKGWNLNKEQTSSINSENSETSVSIPEVPAPVEPQPSTSRDEPSSKRARVEEPKAPQKDVQQTEVPAETAVETPAEVPVENNMNVDDIDEGVGTQQSIPMSGSGGGSGSALAALHTLKTSHHHKPGHSRTFKNEFFMKTWGNANKLESAGQFGRCTAITYPMAHLPVNNIAFYINMSDYTSMFNDEQAYVRVDKVSVTVTPIAPTVAFNTNSSSSDVAAPSHVIYASKAVGLNKLLNTEMVQIQRSSSDAMIIDTTTRLQSVAIWAERLWGRKTGTQGYTDTATNMEIIDCNSYLKVYHPPPTFRSPQGAEVLEHEYELYQSVIAPQLDMRRYLDTQTAKAFESQNKPWVHMEHKVRNSYNHGYAKMNYTGLMNDVFRVDDTTPLARFYSGANSIAASYVNFKGANDHNKWGANVLNRTDTYPLNLQYEFDIAGEATHFKNLENQWLMGTVEAESLKLTEHANPVECHIVPSVNFGIWSIKGNTPEQVNKYINVAFDWKVETSITFTIEHIQQGFNYLPSIQRTEGNAVNTYTQVTGMNYYPANPISDHRVSPAGGVREQVSARQYQARNLRGRRFFPSLLLTKDTNSNVEKDKSKKKK